MHYGWHPWEWEGGGISRRESAVDESRKESADIVAKYQTDYVPR